MARVVAGASVLIALSNIGRLDLLERVVGGGLIPPAVASEVTRGMELPSWVISRLPSRGGSGMRRPGRGDRAP